MPAPLRGVLVRTGKFRPGDLEAVRVSPTAVIGSVAALPPVTGTAADR